MENLFLHGLRLVPHLSSQDPIGLQANVILKIHGELLKITHISYVFQTRECVCPQEQEKPQGNYSQSSLDSKDLSEKLYLNARRTNAKLI